MAVTPPNIAALARPRPLALESLAWAAQTAFALALSMLFVVVTPMSWPMAFMCPIMVCVAMILISADRTVGARVVAGFTFSAAALTGAVFGGVVASLAYLARGEGEPWMIYLPERLQEALDGVVNLSRMSAELEEAQAQVADLVTQLSFSRLPPELLGALQEAREAVASAVLHEFAPAFWACLIVFASLALVPMACAAATAANGLQIGLVNIGAMLFAVPVTLGYLLQVMTLQYFWTRVVLGIGYAGFAAAACTILGGCLIFVRSAHDEVRAAAAALLLHNGQRISSLASTLLSRASEGASAPEPAQRPMEERLRAHLEARAAALPSPEGGFKPAEAPERTVQAVGPTDMQRQMQRLQRSLGVAGLEPPWPGLCSQPGADLDAYGAVAREMELLTADVYAFESACEYGRVELGELVAGDADWLRAALSAALALAAAACAAAAEALAHMPLGGPCVGPALPWRPFDARRWAAAREEVWSVYGALADAYNATVTPDQPLDPIRALQAKARMFLLPTAAQLLLRAEALDAAVATALDVPLPAPLSEAEHCKGAEDVEKGASSDASAASAPAAPARRSAKERAAPYVRNAVAMLVLGGSLLNWKLQLGATAAFLRALPATLRSRAALGAALRKPMVRYGLKLWLGLSVVTMIIVLVLWKGPHNGTELARENDRQTFYSNWLPVYFFLAAVVTINPTVEATWIKGCIRVCGIALGGLIGFGLTANGSVSNSPVYAVAMASLVGALFALPAVVPELKYTLTMTSYTAVGFVAINYAGCCDAHMTWQDFAGKTVPTALGALFGMLFTLLPPHFASQDLLAMQAAVLRDTQATLAGMVDAVMAAGPAGQPPALGATLEGVQRGSVTLAAVGAKMGASSIDRRLQPIGALLLPTPPVVASVQPRLRALLGRVIAAVLTVSRVSWAPAGSEPGAGTRNGEEATAEEKQGKKKSTRKKKKKAPLQLAQVDAVTPGEFTRAVLCSPELGAGMASMLSMQAALAEAVADNLEQGRRPAGVAALRARVAEALDAALAARLELACSTTAGPLHDLMVERAAGVAMSREDVAYFAWHYATLLALDELLAVAGVVLSAPAQQRDWLGAWMGAWAGTRTQV